MNWEVRKLENEGVMDWRLESKKKEMESTNLESKENVSPCVHIIIYFFNLFKNFNPDGL